MPPMSLEIQSFIRNNPVRWESLVSEKPYCISVSRCDFHGHALVMLRYSQIESDFTIPMVRECRGIVLDERDGFSVVSYAFDKFGNYGESYCPQIDRSTMRVTEKVDGSIMKLVRMDDGGLLVSTNGVIDAFSAKVGGFGCPFGSFGEIFDRVLQRKLKEFGDELRSEIKAGYTYVFEMVSPWNRVVVPYDSENLYLIGIRNNITLKEEYFGDHPLSRFFDVPKVYGFGTFEDCMANAASLPWDDEGYVVMDAAFNRVKVKSTAWLAAHYLVNNHSLSYARALELVRMNEVAEVLYRFPDLKGAIDECRERYEEAKKADDSAWRRFEDGGMKSLPRKEQAAFILREFKSKSCGFSLLDGNVATAEEFYRKCPISALLKQLGYK